MKKSLHNSIAVAAIAASFLSGGAGAADDHGKFFSSEIEVTSPSWMQGTLDHRGALFGPFPAGRDVQRELFYTSRKLCGDETPDPPASVKQGGYFLLVDRGGCSFVEKVRNAQRDNATAVIIADSHCVCTPLKSESTGGGGGGMICPEDPTQGCEDVVPVLDDDGTGSDITVPSFMIYKPDGEILKEQLKRGTDVEISLSWPIPPATNGRTEFVLWTTPDDILSHEFIDTFGNAVKELRDRALFKPKMFIKNGIEKGCRRYGAVDPCPGYCTNWGRYCPSRLYDFEEYENKGIKMVVESLRRSCIWEIYGERDGIGMEWWNYMKEWILKCSTGSHYSDRCAEDIYLGAGVEKSLVEQCMEQSGNFRHNVENVLLDQAIVEAEDFDVTFAPALFVNDAVVRGSLTFRSAMDAICATFRTDSDTPFLCSTWEDCKRTCPESESCYVDSGECHVYQKPVLETPAAYNNNDDDYIFDHLTGSPVDLSIPTLSPTKRPADQMDPIPTLSPTKRPADQMTQSTNPPVQSPTNGVWRPMHTTKPVVDPTDTATALTSKQPAGQPTEKVIGQDPGSPRTLPPTHAGIQPQPSAPSPSPESSSSSKETISETVQIYEGNRGGESSPDLALILGLTIGLGCAFLASLAIFLVLRDRRRQDDMRQLSMEDRRELLTRNYFLDEEESLDSRHSRRSRVARYNSRNPDDDHHHHPRRGIRRFFRPRRPLHEHRRSHRKSLKAFEDLWDKQRPASSFELDTVERVRGDYDADISERDRPLGRQQWSPRRSSPRYDLEDLKDDDSLEEEY